MSDGVRIKFEGIRLTRFNLASLNSVDAGVVWLATRRAARRVVGYAREELVRSGRMDTGALYDSIKSKVELTALGPRATIYSDLPYAEWVNRGTGVYGPYGTPIVPTQSPLLRFNTGKRSGGYSSGGFISIASVQGQTPTEFMDKALARLRYL